MKVKSNAQKSMKVKEKFRKNKNAKGKKSEISGKKKKKDLANMTVEDMFTMINDDEYDDYDDSSQENLKKGKKKKKTQKGHAQPEKDENELMAMEDLDDDSFDDDEEFASASKMSREEYLEKLKETDPEFYATLMQSSDLMDTKSSDEEEDDDDIESEEEEETKPRITDNKKGPIKSGSDVKSSAETMAKEESDEDFEDIEDGDAGTITASMIAEWEEELQGPNPYSALKEVQQAFVAATQSLAGGKKISNEVDIPTKYKVQGSQSFNAVIRLCLRHMAPALYNLFQLKDDRQLPSKSKKWVKYRSSFRIYLQQLITLTEIMVEPTVAEAVLRRGILPMIPFYVCHNNLGKRLARRLISMWATSDQKVRVLAFLALFRLSQSFKEDFLEWMLKKMYLAYVQNCRFTSAKTWGVIDFMRLSFVELYSMDPARAYKHAFVYIRQMALHLRNAMLVPKKERIQLVYNWQFIHCLHLWCNLLGKTHPSPALQPMIFPVTQVALGTIKLQPTAHYFPLVFHICKMLTELSRSTGTFIPVLPFLFEVLNKAVLKKQSKKSSLRPFDWMCMLKLSKGQLNESAFKDGIVDQVYDIMVNYLSVESNSIGFPDLVVPTVLQLKAFIKKCKFPNYNKKFKQLLDKITENNNFIESKRKGVKFALSDTKAIRNWEISVRQAGTPLDKYYESWRKVRDKEQQHRTVTEVGVNDFDMPSIKKRELQNKTELDSEEDDDSREIKDVDADDDGEEDEDMNDDDEMYDDDDDEDIDDDVDDYDEDSDSNKGPQKKKTKKEKISEDIKESISDFKIPTNGPGDVVKEFEFSDDDNDSGPDQDDYCVSSESND
ncbi:Nucleolar complex protein 2 [Halocaridina rubra]|uniref:Nucleolar complex protein 2 n=1 Tax=Halocaridina rubra TaxID=373956 RepID=A0AAN8WFH2_HALRR